VHLPVRVGLARSWHVPGLLLLGDAAHPMSPLRAQGINMALRDALTAGRQLLPLLRQGDGDALDAGLAAVAASRLPEIKRMQALQRREALRAERLQGQGWLRGLLASSAPWSGPWLARHWSADQRQLRSGLAETTAMMEAIAKLPWSGNAPVAPP
jgi:2-polyprenyl-6-methoxyphenol hydroxylase-like FAD-dependent oxidoreductase